ncbi:MAG: AAA family ATPase [Catenulispora sp.]
MLQSFRFANHQSFCDEQQLNLMPAYASDHPSLDDQLPVRIAGIFGANASGKSNALNALTFFQYLVLQSDREVEPGQGLQRTPFRLVRTIAEQPSRYVVDLLLNGERHTYGVTLDDERILEEWLVRYVRTDRYDRKGRETTIFERTGDEYRWGHDYKARSDLPFFASITPATALFLSTTARARLGRGTSPTARSGEDLPAQLHWVYTWFRALISRRPSFGYSSRFNSRFVQLGDQSTRERVTHLLNAADFGIEGIEIAPEDFDAEDVPTLAGRRGTRAPRLLFRHHGSDDGVVLEQREESLGTMQLLDLAVSALRVLDSGGLLAVDEVDSSLHPLLTARFINLFRSGETNPNHAQLLFTSHDATLLGHLDGEQIVCRDEVWFAEKNREGQSSLYSLAEFKPRKSGENWERRYLNGAYGGIPELSINLFEMALRARGDYDGEEG